MAVNRERLVTLRRMYGERLAKLQAEVIRHERMIREVDAKIAYLDRGAVR